MTKKETQQWLKEVGFNSSYSGNQKIMYVHDITQEILEGYNLKTNGFILKAK